jgi:hypothetical protein
MPPGIDNGGDMLTADLLLGHQGALAAADPNVIAQPHIVEHTLPAGSPPSVGGR